MMRRSTTGLIALTALLVLAALAGVAGVVETDGEKRDPVLEYYWKMAGERLTAQDPAAARVRYSFRSKSYYFTVVSGGAAQRTDSLVVDHTISAEGVDSQTVIAGNSRRFRQLDLGIPNIFADSYHIYFFPNDTGGASLAIGFRADSTLPQQPDGMVIIDRYDYSLRRLYLYYPNKPDFKRFTRTFWFTYQDEFIFVDSVCDVAARLGIFSLENYRIETNISDLRVLPPLTGQ